MYGRGYIWVRQLGLFAAMGLVVVASFGWAFYQSAANPNAAYFSTFTRVWELGVGALVAIAGPWLMSLPHGVRPILAYLGLGGVGASLFLIDSTVQFPAPWAALPVVSTAIVIASFHGADVRLVPLLTNPVARWFGDTSYTLYLWHWPVIVLLLTLLPEGPVFYVTALVVALGLTAITYRYYENPIRHSPWLRAEKDFFSSSATLMQRGLTTSAWGIIGAFLATSVVMAILAINYQEKLAAVAGDQQPVVADLNAPLEPVDPCFGAPALPNPSCTLLDPDRPLQPGIDNFNTDYRGQLSCYREGDDPARVESCTYGYDGPGAVRIALVGDSHAAAMLPALWKVLNVNKWQLTTYVGTQCIWRTPALQSCPIMGDIQDKLAAERYDLVLTTGHRNFATTPDQFRGAWAPIAAAGTKIGVLADNPSVSEESLECLTRVVGKTRIDECATPLAEAYARPDPLIAAADAFPGAALIDLSQFYCKDDRCPSVVGNVIVYRDTNHITGTYAETLAPALADGVRRALGTPS